VSDLTEVSALEDGTSFIFSGECYVVAVKGNYALLCDATGYATVYMNGGLPEEFTT